MDQEYLAGRTTEYLASVESDWQSLLITVDGEGRSIPLERVFFMLEARRRPERGPLEPPPPDLDPTSQARWQAAGIEPAAPPAPSPPPDLDPASQARWQAAGIEPAAPPAPSPPISLKEALQEAEQMVLLGEPGAGKSTTLQYIGLCLARAGDNWHQDRLGLARPYIPIRLLLQTVAQCIAEKVTLWDVLRAEVRGRLQLYTEEEAEALLKHWQKERGLMVLLDGLDEVPDALHPTVRERIALFARVSKCRLIVTSRTAGFTSLAGLPEYTLKPLEDEEKEILPFIRFWICTFRPKWEAQADERSRDLLDKMKDQPALRRLTNNPLILQLSVRYYARTEGEIARNRAYLYDEWLAEAWQRAERRGADKSQKEQALRALEELAWHLHAGKENDTEKLCQALTTAKLADSETAAAGILSLLREKVGLLERFAEEGTKAGRARFRYTFAHQTMREYLVVRRLQRAWEENPKRTFRFLRPRLHLPAWREPLALLAGSLPEKDAVHLIRRIYGAGSPCEGQLRRDLFLAAELAAEAGCWKRVEADFLPGLFAALRDADVRWAAAEALGKIGALALPVLATALQDPDAGVRQAAAFALGRIGAPALPALTAALQDPDAFVRVAAAFALGRIGAPEAVAALTAALQDPHAGVRQAAAEALGEIGASAVPALTAALRGPKADVRWAAARALGQIGAPKAVPALLTALQDADADIRWAAAQILGEIGALEAVPALITALQDEDSSMRWAAARALGQIGAPKAVPALLTALQDADADIRWAAAEALGRIGDQEAIPALIAALHDIEADVREATADALGRIGTQEAIPALLTTLQDNDAFVRGRAAKALGQIGAQETVPPLLAALQDTDTFVREATAEALGRIGAREAVPALIAALQDTEAGVRRAAVEALERIGAQEVISPLLAALRDTDAFVRRVAAEALGQIGDPKAVPALIAALQDKEWLVSWAAAEALGRVGTQETISDLLAILQDTDTNACREVPYALGRLVPRLQPPADRKEWKQLRRQLRKLRKWASKHKQCDLLRVVLERESAFDAAASSWQDPLVDPPWCRRLRQVARWIGIGLGIFALGGLFALLALFIAGLQDIAKDILKNWWQSRPLVVILPPLFVVGGLAALFQWLKDLLGRKGK